MIVPNVSRSFVIILLKASPRRPISSRPLTSTLLVKSRSRVMASMVSDASTMGRDIIRER